MFISILACCRCFHNSCSSFVSFLSAESAGLLEGPGLQQT